MADNKQLNFYSRLFCHVVIIIDEDVDESGLLMFPQLTEALDVSRDIIVLYISVLRDRLPGFPRSC